MGHAAESDEPISTILRPYRAPRLSVRHRPPKELPPSEFLVVYTDHAGAEHPLLVRRLILKWIPGFFGRHGALYGMRHLAYAMALLALSDGRAVHMEDFKEQWMAHRPGEVELLRTAASEVVIAMVDVAMVARNYKSIVCRAEAPPRAADILWTFRIGWPAPKQ